MPPNRKVANLLGLAVLAWLVKGPMHAYEMSRALRENGESRSIKFTHGSLYMVFGQLEKAGFIAVRETVRTGQRPERTVYELTEAGRAELTDWLRELIAKPVHEYPRFVAALSVIGALRPGEVAGLLRERREALEEEAAAIRGLMDGADGVHPLFLVEEEYRLAMVRAEAAFVERFIERIEDPVDGWAPMWDAFHDGVRTQTEEAGEAADSAEERERS